MAKYNKRASSSKIFSFVLTVTFGLLAAVVAFAALRGGVFELRTKAAAEEVTLKQWLFERSTEGWSAKEFGRSTVSGGNYSLVIGRTSEQVNPEEVCTGQVKNGNYKCRTRNVKTPLNPRIENNDVKTVLRHVNHKLRIRLAVALPSSPNPPGCQPPPTCAYLREPCRYAREGVTFCAKDTIQKGQESVGMEKPRPMTTKVPMSISYRLQGKQGFETALVFAGVTDGVVHEYSLDLPREVSLKRIDELRVSFAELRKEVNVRVDVADISIIGLREVSTPVPGQTFQGLLIKNNSGSSYALTVASGPGSGRVMTYLLLQAKTSGECPLGALCKMIARPPVEIDFSQYLGKQVVVTGRLAQNNQSGIVTGPAGGKGWSENPSNVPSKEGISQPAIYVTSIKLASDTRPCQPIPAGCSDPKGNVMCKMALMEGYQWCNPIEPKPPTGCYYNQVQCVRAPCDPVLVCPTSGALPTRGVPPSPATSGVCVRGGCSGELCVPKGSAPQASICVYRGEYACYQDAQCERQPNGACGWTPSTELSACLSQAQTMEQ